MNVFRRPVSGTRLGRRRSFEQPRVDVIYSSQDPQSGYRGDISTCRLFTKYPVKASS